MTKHTRGISFILAITMVFSLCTGCSAPSRSGGGNEKDLLETALSNLKDTAIDGHIINVSSTVSQKNEETNEMADSNMNITFSIKDKKVYSMIEAESSESTESLSTYLEQNEDSTYNTYMNSADNTFIRGTNISPDSECFTEYKDGYTSFLGTPLDATLNDFIVYFMSQKEYSYVEDVEEDDVTYAKYKGQSTKTLSSNDDGTLTETNASSCYIYINKDTEELEKIENTFSNTLFDKVDETITIESADEITIPDEYKNATEDNDASLSGFSEYNMGFCVCLLSLASPDAMEWLESQMSENSTETTTE